MYYMYMQIERTMGLHDINSVVNLGNAAVKVKRDCSTN